MARDPYEPKGPDKWGPTALLLRGISELFGSGRKRWLAAQAEEAKQADREQGGASPKGSS